ncbi:MAG TPA: hypothetical protein VMW62_06390 [Chloroflexota bacterium]|nr:hypothetical protein [Chloroflexota bacterium]
MEFTRHARNKCRRYNITAAELQALLALPARIELRADGTPSAVGLIRGVRYRVIYVVENVQTIVITVWDEKE